MTRKEQDEFAVRSHHLAAKAHKDGLLADEILAINGSKEDNGIRADSSYEKLSTLKVLACLWRDDVFSLVCSSVSLLR